MTLIRCIDPNAVEASPLVIARTGQPAVCGDVVDVADSALAAKLLLQTDVWEPADAVNELDAPPKHGAGSGRDAWAKYAELVGVDVADGMSRDDIIAAVESGDTDTDPAPEAEKETL